MGKLDCKSKRLKIVSKIAIGDGFRKTWRGVFGRPNESQEFRVGWEPDNLGTKYVLQKIWVTR